MVEEHDRIEELRAFDDTRAGVKGLVDAGVVVLPKIFIIPPDELARESGRGGGANLRVPVIDLAGIEAGSEQRGKVVGRIRQASEEWGFFQVVNHGVPPESMGSMIDGVRSFHEQDEGEKAAIYSRDRTKRVRFESNIDLYRSKTANWRDTLTVSMLVDDRLDPEDLPAVCRDSTLKYINHVTELGNKLFELLAEALGLDPDRLNAMECGRGRVFVCHYYPVCPEPELTLGVSKHSDPSFLTVLLQDRTGGLQVLHENHWVDVPPVEGGLVVNVGDFLQILSNGRFKSEEHRVVVNRVGPRISTACFFTGVTFPPKVYGPIQELTSEGSPPAYRDLSVGEYMETFFARPIDTPVLDHFKI